MGVRMSRKILFKATLREINYLIDNNYLNKKGIEWVNTFTEDVEVSSLPSRIKKALAPKSNEDRAMYDVACVEDVE